MLETLRTLTADMWSAPMEKFMPMVYNADEILPLISENCKSFGTNNGQELLIYDDQNKVKYSCSMTEIFGELVLENVYSADGKIYEYDFDKIYDELRTEAVWQIQHKEV